MTRTPTNGQGRAHTRWSVVAAALLATGCASGASSEAPTPQPPRSTEPAPRVQAPASGVPDGMRSTQEGVYTAGQAQEGRQVFQGVCVECHTFDEFRGSMMAGWEGAPLHDLYDLISTTMPESNPGSLNRNQYAAVVAFILELNEMPAGDEELSTRASVLRSIVFTR